MDRGEGIYHILALTAVAIWGTTFVSTKLLLAEGMTPAEIMFYRFLIAYLALKLYKPTFRLPESWRDEALFAAAGLTGGSLYFLTENMALQITLASNVALLLATAPILTVLLSRLWLGRSERIGRPLAAGSVLALAGVALVVFNGSFILKIQPAGDLLTLAAALTWALYNICLKKLDGFRLKDKTGNVVWDLQAYDFLKQQTVADTVHPSLWLNGKANIEAGVFEVLAGKIYQVRGIDVANLTFVRSKTGWIVIDVTTNTEAAAYGLRITEEVLGENIRDHIRAVIISHSHADHFGGIKGIVSPQQVGKAEGQVRIYVPAGFDEETVKENVYAGTAMFHRSKYQFGGDLLAGPKGRVSTGLGLGTSSGTLSYITPTDFIAEDTTLTIDGLEVEFQLTPGTEAPAEMNNYFPEYRAFWAAENCTGTLRIF